MKSTAKLAATLAFGFICSLANAQDADIVVFIEDLTLPSHSPASNFTVITESDIAEGGYSSIIDVLERNSSFRASTDSLFNLSEYPAINQQAQFLYVPLLCQHLREIPQHKK